MHRSCARFAWLLRVLWVAAVPLPSGCVSVPEGAFGRPPVAETRLEVADYAGNPAQRLDAPRWPRLRAVLPESVTRADDVAWLFRGPSDEELLGDLERSPLLAAHRERAVPCSLAFSSADSGQSLELMPLAPLDPGEHVFAIAAWALDQPTPLTLELVVSGGLESGARMAAAWPADGSISVGTDLPLAWVAFDGEVRGADQAVWLEGPDGYAVDAEVAIGDCDALAIGALASSCITLAPRGLLAPLAEHRIVIGSEARDAHGAPIGPADVVFRTGAGPDARAPEPAPRACAIDEVAFELGCALISDRSIALRIAASEPFALRATAGDRSWNAIAPSAEVALAIDALEPGELLELDLELKDSTGNALRLRESFGTYPDLATLSITEVLADPLGEEPEQELVELWNFGQTPVPLDGISLSDQPSELGVALSSALLLDPDARVLLVADGFDASASDDVAIPAGVPLVRAGKALGRAGLANRGEPLFLRDRMGRRLSAAPALPAPSAGTCIARISDDPRDGTLSSFAANEETGCTPGS
jgi:hypothetical protein